MSQNCICGCGEQTTIYRNKPRLYIHGHNQKGENHWSYKNGREITNYGYVRVLVNHPHPRKHKGKVLEHILVMENALGRFLTRNEDVHHKDGNRQNNDISNLELLSRKEHSRLHKRKPIDIICPRCGSRYLQKKATKGDKHVLYCTDCNGYHTTTTTNPIGGSGKPHSESTIIRIKLAKQSRRYALMNSMSGTFHVPDPSK